LSLRRSDFRCSHCGSRALCGGKLPALCDL